MHLKEHRVDDPVSRESDRLNKFVQSLPELFWFVTVTVMCTSLICSLGSQVLQMPQFSDLSSVQLCDYFPIHTRSRR